MGFYLICGTHGYAPGYVSAGQAQAASAIPRNSHALPALGVEPLLEFAHLCYAATPSAHSGYFNGMALQSRMARAFSQWAAAPSPSMLAAALSPALAGYMLMVSSFGWPLVVCRALKFDYDLTLLNLFQSVKPPEEDVVTSEDWENT